MKRCLSCNLIYSSAGNCTACGYGPASVDGFAAYAPEFAHGGGGFEASYFAQLAKLENGNFWFEARNRLILWAIQKYIPDVRSFFEIGCGTGYVLSGVARKFTETRLSGSEIFTDGLAFAADRVRGASFMQMDARRIPFYEEFDAIGAFDVLEHIQEDVDVLTQVQHALKPNGFLFATVPQHQWLWSASDAYAHHVRRYSATDLHAKVKAAGFDIQLSTSFVSLLLPAMYVSRLLNRNASSQADPEKEFRLSPTVNSVFYRIMVAEFGMIKAKVRFPVGGSRLIVARKAKRS